MKYLSPEDIMCIKGEGLKPLLRNSYDVEGRGQCTMQTLENALLSSVCVQFCICVTMYNPRYQPPILHVFAVAACFPIPSWLNPCFCLKIYLGSGDSVVGVEFDRLK